MGFTLEELMELETAMKRHIAFLEEDVDRIHRRNLRLREAGQLPNHPGVEAYILERLGEANSALQKVQKLK